jgi:tetratricopeptide (TPR) repeat protein
VRVTSTPGDPLLRFEAADTLSPLGEAALFSRRPGGAWAPVDAAVVGRDERGPYFRVEAPAEGSLEFAVQVRDAAGNASDLDGAEARAAVAAATHAPAAPVGPAPAAPEAPRVLIPAGGTRWTAGHSVLLKWVTPAADGARAAARIEWRAGPEAPWQPVAENREPTGFFFWTVPNTPAAAAQVRVTVGDKASEPSAPFSIAPARAADVGAAQAEYEQARGLLAQQKTAEAVAHLERALEHWSDFAQALNDLGSAYAAMEERETALRFFLDAVRTEPSNAAYHHNAGQAMLELGLTEPALRSLGDAVRLAKKGDRRLAVRLGETLVIGARRLHEAGRSAEAAVAAGWVLWIPGVTELHRAAADELLARLKKP